MLARVKWRWFVTEPWTTTLRRKFIARERLQLEVCPCPKGKTPNSPYVLLWIISGTGHANILFHPNMSGLVLLQRSTNKIWHGLHTTGSQRVLTHTASHSITRTNIMFYGTCMYNHHYNQSFMKLNSFHQFRCNYKTGGKMLNISQHRFGKAIFCYCVGTNVNTIIIFRFQNDVHSRFHFRK